MEDISQLKRSIRGFSFEKCNGGSQGFKRLLLQLFGFAGHGKSSFINSCKYVLDSGEYVEVAETGTQAGRVVTKARWSYPLTQTITLVDNRGCGKLDMYETGEIFAQLANLLPLDKEVEWTEGLGLMDRIFQSECHINTSDFIVPIMVYSSRHSLPTQQEEDLKKIISKALELTGICPIVILTHKDNGNTSAYRRRFKEMGVDHIFAVENYTQENIIRTRKRDEEFLRFLVGVTNDVEYRMNQKLNPERDVKKRMHFIVKYVSERELKIQEENKELEKVMEVSKLTTELKTTRTTSKLMSEEDEIRHEGELKHQREEMEERKEYEKDLLQIEIQRLQEEIEKLDLGKKDRRKSFKHGKKEPCALQ